MGCCSSSGATASREVPPAVVGAPEGQEESVEVDLFDLDSLVRWIEWADIGLLDTNWLLEAPLEVILHRRQELPPEAFVPMSDLRDWPIVALSYGWADPANPDPQGDYATMLKRYFGREGEQILGQMYGKTAYPEGAALFWDHKSLYQHRFRPDWDGKRETFKQYVIQERTPEENVKFRRAMAGMQALYFHAQADALIAQKVPEGGRNPRPYEQRGWTAMECAGACLSGRAIALDDFIGQIDVNFKAAIVPMSIEDFETKEVRGRAFFREEDRPEVVRMYGKGFAAYASSSEELWVNVCLADPEKCTQLAQVLPQFENLWELMLEGYPNPFRANQRVPELDAALDALARRGCSVLAGDGVESAYQWLPDAGPGGRIHTADHNPAHNPPRQY